VLRVWPKFADIEKAILWPKGNRVSRGALLPRNAGDRSDEDLRLRRKVDYLNKPIRGNRS
jgi:hypothetical protein